MVPGDMQNGSVLVTGASGALGSAVVAHLVRVGRTVVALGSSRRNEGSTGAPGPALTLAADVADVAQVTAAIAQAEAQIGPVEGAVLVAGGWAGAPLADEPDDLYRRMISANLDTVHACLRALVPGMRNAGRGSIVVVGSRASVRPWTSAGASAYAASKAGAVALVEAVAAEVLDRGVRVNAVLPSTIRTAANAAAMPDADASRWVDPASIAKVVAFLLSDDAADISGAAIPIYGRS